MSRLLRRQELTKPFWRQTRYQRKLIVRHYHLEPGEENLCLVAKSYNDLIMEVRTVTQPKENEVLIRVGSCCLSTFDFDYLTRFYGKDRALYESVVLGSFGTGVVVKTGAGVTEAISEGDRVALEPGICCNKCSMCASGKTNLCANITYLGSQGQDGTLCRFINHPISFTHKLEDNVSLEVGTLATKIAGCIHNYRRAGITKDSKVLIMGTSLVGLVAIMVIKHLGVGSIFVAETSNYRLKLARNFGADYVIKMTAMQSPEYPEYLKEIIDSIHSGEPDIVIDTIGSASSLETSFHLSKSGGRIVLMNLMARPIPARFLHVTLREISLIGAFSYTHSSFKEAIKLLTNEQIPFKNILPLKIPLERALDAFSHGRATGGENLFIIVNSYNEEHRKSEPIPQTSITKTAAIPKIPIPDKNKEQIPISTEKPAETKPLAMHSTTTEKNIDMQQREKITDRNRQPENIDSQYSESEEAKKLKKKTSTAEKQTNEAKIEEYKQTIIGNKVDDKEVIGIKASEQEDTNKPKALSADEKKFKNPIKEEELDQEKGKKLNTIEKEDKKSSLKLSDSETRNIESKMIEENTPSKK